MNNRLLKYAFYAFVALLMAWLLPASYDFLSKEAESPQFIIYSSVNKSFLLQEQGSDGFYYRDTKGQSFTQYEADSLLPTLSYPMLMREGRFPDSILGQEVSPSIIQEASFFFTHEPQSLNQHTVPLYPLLESKPPRITLSYPNDIFRLTEQGIEFINMENNSLYQKKSDYFSRALSQAGVSFPILAIGGNPTPKKDYDEGYVFSDSKDKLFHFKMVEGQPFIKEIKHKFAHAIEHIYVTEYADRRFLAFLLDSQGQFFALEQGSLNVRPIALPKFNPYTDDLIILGNLFDWNVEVDRDGQRHFYAIDNKSLECLAQLDLTQESKLSEKVASWIFPFRLSFESSLDKYFKPRFSDFSLKATLLYLALFLLFIFLRPKKRN